MDGGAGTRHTRTTLRSTCVDGLIRSTRIKGAPLECPAALEKINGAEGPYSTFVLNKRPRYLADAPGRYCFPFSE